jgi:DNA-binding response OmpR family regulator
MKKLLIIEDSLDIQQTLKQILELEGYEVTVASHGQEGLDKLRLSTFEPHLILLDLMMPIMDGHQFRKIQMKDEKLSVIPVIIMTADGNFKPEMSEIMGEGFIRKPLDIDDLLKTVETHCR